MHTGIDSLKADVIPKLKYVLDFDRCGFALLNEDRSSYRLLTLLETRPTAPWVNEDSLPLDIGIYGEVIRSGEPSVVSSSATQEPPSAVTVADAALEAGSLRAVLCLPLQAGAETFGSIAFVSNDIAHFGRADIHLASIVAMHLSLAIDRWKMIEHLSAVGQRLADLNVTLEERVEQTTSDLQNQAQILQSVLNSMGDGVVVADEHGKFSSSTQLQSPRPRPVKDLLIRYWFVFHGLYFARS